MPREEKDKKEEKEKKEKKEKKEEKEKKEKKEDKDEKKEKKEKKTRLAGGAGDDEGFDVWGDAGSVMASNPYASQPQKPQDKRDKEAKIQAETKKHADAGKNLIKESDAVASLLSNKKDQVREKIKKAEEETAKKNKQQQRRVQEEKDEEDETFQIMEKGGLGNFMERTAVLDVMKNTVSEASSSSGGRCQVSTRTAMGDAVFTNRRTTFSSLGDLKFVKGFVYIRGSSEELGISLKLVRPATIYACLSRSPNDDDPFLRTWEVVREDDVAPPEFSDSSMPEVAQIKRKVIKKPDQRNVSLPKPPPGLELCLCFVQPDFHADVFPREEETEEDRLEREKREAADRRAGRSSAKEEKKEEKGADEKLEEVLAKVAKGDKLTNKEKRLYEKHQEKKQVFKDVDEEHAVGDLKAFSLTLEGGKNDPPPSGDAFVCRNFKLSAPGQTLFDNAEITIVQGHRYGILGPNGQGKTTILRHIAAREMPVPLDWDVILVEQEAKASDRSAVDEVLAADTNTMDLIQKEEALIKKLEEMEAQIERNEEVNIDTLNSTQTELVSVATELQATGADAAEAKVRKILCGLGFTNGLPDEDRFSMDRPVNQFSGGWRMRISLAKALFLQPKLLMLDEPTNHLDLDAVLWLDDYLSEHYPHAVVVVSHDADFLDNIVTDILHLDNKKLVHYRGDYSAFRKMHAQKRVEKDKEYKKQQDALKMHKKKGKTKEEAEELVKKTFGIESLDGLMEKYKDYVVKFNFFGHGMDRSLGLNVSEVAFSYNGKKPWLLEDCEMGVDCGSRIAIVGPNGAGKTTLLNIMMQQLEPCEGEVSVSKGIRIRQYHQHFEELLPLEKTGVEYLQSAFNLANEEPRRYLGQFGLPGSSHFTKIGNLSGGQKARVAFAALMLMKPHIIVLDEPTNHLDIESVEALTDAVSQFNGGLVLVTHDARLITEIDCELWVCEEGTCYRFEKDFDGYRNKVLKQLEERQEEVERMAQKRAQQRAAQRARHVKQEELDKAAKEKASKLEAEQKEEKVAKEAGEKKEKKKDAGVEKETNGKTEGEDDALTFGAKKKKKKEKKTEEDEDEEQDIGAEFDFGKKKKTKEKKDKSKAAEDGEVDEAAEDDFGSKKKKKKTKELEKEIDEDDEDEDDQNKQETKAAEPKEEVQEEEEPEEEEPEEEEPEEDVNALHEHFKIAEVSGMRALKKQKGFFICHVDVGGDDEVPIVTRLQGVIAGSKVVVALEGAMLGDEEVAGSHVHGEWSAGIICSAADMGWEGDPKMCIILKDECEIGTPAPASAKSPLLEGDGEEDEDDPKKEATEEKVKGKVAKDADEDDEGEVGNGDEEDKAQKAKGKKSKSKHDGSEDEDGAPASKDKGKKAKGKQADSDNEAVAAPAPKAKNKKVKGKHVESEEEEEATPAPKAKGKKAKGKQAESDEEEEAAPVPKAKGKKGKAKQVESEEEDEKPPPPKTKGKKAKGKRMDEEEEEDEEEETVANAPNNKGKKADEVGAAENQDPNAKHGEYKVAKVLSAEPMKKKKGSTLVELDVATDDHVMVVTNYANMQEGNLVILAPEGSTASGKEVKKLKVAGEWTSGVICGPMEMGWSGDASLCTLLGKEHVVGSFAPLNMAGIGKGGGEAKEATSAEDEVEEENEDEEGSTPAPKAKGNKNKGKQAESSDDEEMAPPPKVKGKTAKGKQTESDEEEVVPAPKAKGKKAKGKQADSDEEEPPAPAPKAKGKKAKGKPEDSDEEEEPPAPAPKAKGKKVKGKQVDSDEDEEEPPAPGPKARGKKAKGKQADSDEEPAPVPKTAAVPKARGKKAKGKQDDSDDDMAFSKGGKNLKVRHEESSSEEDEAPAPKAKAKAKAAFAMFLNSDSESDSGSSDSDSDSEPPTPPPKAKGKQGKSKKDDSEEDDAPKAKGKKMKGKKDDSDEDEPAPKAKGKKSKGKKDDSDSDEPAPKAKGKKSKGKQDDSDSDEPAPKAKGKKSKGRQDDSDSEEEVPKAKGKKANGKKEEDEDVPASKKGGATENQDPNEKHTEYKVGKVLKSEPMKKKKGSFMVEIDIDDLDSATVVTSYANVTKGNLVIIALEGATVAGKKVSRQKVGGEWTSGVLCGPTEMGWSGDASLAVILGDEHVVGTPAPANLAGV